MFGWIFGFIGMMIAVAIGFGGLGAVTAEKAMMLCGAFAVLFVAALLAIASRGSSRTD